MEGPANGFGHNLKGNFKGQNYKPVEAVVLVVVQVLDPLVAGDKPIELPSDFPPEIDATN